MESQVAVLPEISILADMNVLMPEIVMALGAMAGLYKRATEGGSWRVRVGLARTGRCTNNSAGDS